jgi:hypothetical protein
MAKTEVLELLESGNLEVEGFLPWSSNYTFLVRVFNTETEILAVYKPRQGERPLWDFAQGSLYQREQAAFVVSDALDWGLVPPTIAREGPHGLGSFQIFIDHDPECHYFTLEGKSIYRRQLQQIVLLDLIINNADRKGGHILLEQSTNPSPTHRLWAIDHGVCFHAHHKLRTVVWEFAGTRIPADLLSDLMDFKEKMHGNSHGPIAQLQALLSERETEALKNRLERIIESGYFWKPGPGRHYPWPPV